MIAPDPLGRVARGVMVWRSRREVFTRRARKRISVQMAFRRGRKCPTTYRASIHVR
jgi:hypothetical protein